MLVFTLPKTPQISPRSLMTLKLKFLLNVKERQLGEIGSFVPTLDAVERIMSK